MGDVEYEALKVPLEQLPQHFTAAPKTYTLVHAITPLEENKSFLEKVEFGERLCGIAEDESFIIERSNEEAEQQGPGPSQEEKTTSQATKESWRNSPTWDFLLQRGPHLNVSDTGSDSETEKFARHGEDDDEDGDVISHDDRRRILETERRLVESGVILDADHDQGDQRQETDARRQGARRHRRRLPEIPKHKKPLEGVATSSIFDELSAATPSWSGPGPGPSMLPGQREAHINSMATSMILNITNQEVFKGWSGQDQDTLSPMSPAVDTTAMANRLEMLDPTHRGLHRFVPRHRDEILIDIGDPVYVTIEAEDGWCDGINLRTGEKGIFPLAHVVDVDYNDFDPAGVEEKKERYLLDYLGSVQCAQKGVEIIVQSVIKMTSRGPDQAQQKTPCILEISDKGIKMVDKSKPGDGNGVPSNEYFYNLKNVTFCGFHPKDHRYFGFITKHPSPCLQRYACHVFVSESSTRCVAQAYGRAFRRFYQKFIETAFPTEDIYLDE